MIVTAAAYYQLRDYPKLIETSRSGVTRIPTSG